MARKHLPNKEINPIKTSETNPIFFENGYCRGKKTRHGYMMYNPNDFIGKTLEVYGEWSFAEIDLLSKLVKPGHLVLDVGAYIGTHTLSFAKMVQSDGFVFAFEPQRIAYEFLCANVVLNNLINVFPIHAAVSNSSGEIKVPIINPSNPSNTAAFQISGYSMGDTVRQLTIDSLNLARCNLIKIDVEGMESNVIAGAKNTLQQFRPVLFVENNGYGDPQNLIRQILELNYQAWWFFSPPEDPTKSYNPEVNDKNMLCLPAEWKIELNGLIPVEDENDTGIKAFERLLKTQAGK